jgi:hypothetical protein
VRYLSGQPQTRGPGGIASLGLSASTELLRDLILLGPKRHVGLALGGPSARAF